MSQLRWYGIAILNTTEQAGSAALVPAFSADMSKISNEGSAQGMH